MSLKKNISSFRKDWLAQSTSNRPLVIIPKGEPYRLQLTGYSRWIEEKLLELLNQKQ